MNPPPRLEQPTKILSTDSPSVQMEKGTRQPAAPSLFLKIGIPAVEFLECWLNDLLPGVERSSQNPGVRSTQLYLVGKGHVCQGSEELTKLFKIDELRLLYFHPK